MSPPGRGGSPPGSDRAAPEHLAGRVPPGQVLTTRFPVLHEGAVPDLSPEAWDLTCFGEVEAERTFDWQAFRALPRFEDTSDFHCVTTWSRLDNRWSGVASRELARHLGIRPTARHVLAYGHLDEDPRGYTANVRLEVFLGADVLLADTHDGAPLTPTHGAPVRLVVPHYYAWKSVKWLRALEFLPEDRRGYWEVRGYNNNAEPFAEQRYSTQDEGPIGP